MVLAGNGSNIIESPNLYREKVCPKFTMWSYLFPGGLVAGELRGHGLVGVGEEHAQIVEHAGVVRRQERGGRALLAGTPRAT